MLALVPSLTSAWGVGQYSRNLEQEASVVELCEWSLREHLGRGWRSAKSLAGAGVDTSSASTALALKDKQK